MGVQDTYHVHMTTTMHIEGTSNYVIRCSCGNQFSVASLSDVFVAQLALDHVKRAQSWCRDEDCDKNGHPEFCADTTGE